MPFSVYLGWGLLVPSGLSLIYGLVSKRAMNALGYAQKNTVWPRMRFVLPSLVLSVLWGAVNIPLPAIYVLAFLAKMFQLFNKRENRARKLFLVHLDHLVTMALHMILLGILSLALQTPMSSLLLQPLWRITTICAILAVNISICLLLPRMDMLLSVLRTQSESEEVRPFMVFLWFCNLFMLLDSVLCISDIHWKLLPLFLIGSTVMLEFYLACFLHHLYTILKVRYLEEDHCHLMAELELRNEAAAKLRQKSSLDSLTGVFSRRYAIERTAFLLQSKKSFSLVFIDLDNLKRINDQEGHHAGDLYLIRFAKEFGACLCEMDILARVGGDEFAVLLPDYAQKAAETLIGNIRTLLESQISPPLSFSYGVSFVPENSGDSVECILHRADQAMYLDKHTRTGC